MLVPNSGWHLNIEINYYSIESIYTTYTTYTITSYNYLGSYMLTEIICWGELPRSGYSALPFSPGLHLGSYALNYTSTTTPNMSDPDKPPVPGDALHLPPRALRDVLRVCLSAKEYRFLHESVIKRAPAVQNKLPSPSRYDVIARPKNRHSEAAIRSSIRVFVGSGIALKLADLLITRFQGAPQ